MTWNSYKIAGRRVVYSCLTGTRLCTMEMINDCEHNELITRNVVKYCQSYLECGSPLAHIWNATQSQTCELCCD